MVTLGIGLMLFEAANQLPVDHRRRGRALRRDDVEAARPVSFDLTGSTAYVYSLAVLFVAVRRSRAGSWPRRSALAARRPREREADAGDRRAGGARLIAIYTISAAMAGVAGGLLAQTTQFVGLDVFGFPRSADLMIMLVLGGAGRLYGGLVGAAVFMIAHHFLSDLNPIYWQFWLGLLLVVVVLFARGGILGAAESLAARAEAGDESRRALRTEGCRKQFGAFKANSDVTLAFPHGARHALIGPNGAGKTTLINLLTGVLPPTRGRGVPRRRADHRAAAARARQARHDAHVPDQHAVRRAHRARVGRAGHLRAQGTRAACGSARCSRSARRSTRRRRCWPRCASPARRTSSPATCPTASSGWSRSRSRSRRGRASCCSTSRRPAFRPARAPSSSASSPALPRDVTILFIEHDMELVFRFAERITVLVGGRGADRGHAGRDRRRPARARGLPRRGAAWLSCSRSRASPPATATASCSRTSRWRSRRATASRCWAATAWARRRCSSR